MSPRPENGINRNLFVGLHYRAISKEAPVGNNRRCAGQNGVDAGHLEMQQSREREEHLINYIMDNKFQDGGCSNGEHPELSTVHGTSRRTPRPRVQRAGLLHNLSHSECAFCFFFVFFLAVCNLSFYFLCPKVYICNMLRIFFCKYIYFWNFVNKEIKKTHHINVCSIYSFYLFFIKGHH